MKWKHIAITIFAAFTAIFSYAQSTVSTTNANGEKRTTIVDENGNLKIIESDSKASVPSPGQAPAVSPKLTPPTRSQPQQPQPAQPPISGPMSPNMPQSMPLPKPPVPNPMTPEPMLDPSASSLPPAPQGQTITTTPATTPVIRPIPSTAPQI